MLYVVTWTVAPEHRDAAQARFSESGGAPPPGGVQMLGRWHSVEGNRGLCVARSDDPIAMARWVQQWSDVLSFDMFPALEDEDFAKILG